MESVLYITNATGTTLFTSELPLKTQPFRCVTKGFLRTQSIQRLFSQCVRAQDAPILDVCFPDSDK